MGIAGTPPPPKVLRLSLILPPEQFHSGRAQLRRQMLSARLVSDRKCYPEKRVFSG